MANEGRGRVSRGAGTPRGERHGRARLTDAQVAELRELYVLGWRVPALATRYGVSRSCARMLATWQRRS